MTSEIGKWLIGTGTILVVTGVIHWLFPDRLHWLGNLPGDIRVERKNVSFYFPLTKMIIFSIILSLLFTLLAQMFGR